MRTLRHWEYYKGAQELRDFEYSILSREWLTAAYNRLLSGGWEHDEIISIIKGYVEEGVTADMNRFINAMEAKMEEGEDGKA
jgi:hypothetical protein